MASASEQFFKELGGIMVGVNEARNVFCTAENSYECLRHPSPESEEEWRKKTQEARESLYVKMRELETRKEILKGFYAAQSASPELKEMMENMAKEIKNTQCPICLDAIKAGDLDITNCGHHYCKPCLFKVRNQCRRPPHSYIWNCAVCRKPYLFSE